MVHDKIEKSVEILFPVAESLHSVDMVAYPVLVDRDGFPFNENYGSSPLDDIPEVLYHHSEIGVTGGKDTWDGKLEIIVSPVAVSGYVHRGKGILERNRSALVDLIGLRGCSVERLC